MVATCWRPDLSPVRNGSCGRKLTTVAGFHRSFGECDVVFYSAAADADSANHRSIRIFDGYSAAKSDQTAIAVFDAVKRLAWLRHPADFGCLHIKITGRSSLSNGDVYTAEPGAIRTNERLEEIVSSLERDDRVKVVVFDSAVEGFFLTHYDFVAKPEDSAKFPVGPTDLQPLPDMLVRLSRASIEDSRFSNNTGRFLLTWRRGGDSNPR
jgi:hypothetical protein